MLDQPRHIVHIIPALGFGGAERCVVDIARYADPKRFRFTILSFSQDVSFASSLPDYVSVIVLDKSQYSLVKFLGILKNKLRNLQPDIVHTHLFGGDFWGGLAARSLSLPVISTEHNINVSESWLRIFCKRYIARFSRIFVASSEAIAADMRVRYAIKKNITVVRYGIDLERWTNISSLPNPPSRPLQLLMIGRLTRQKGHNLALRALAKLADIDWRLTIVGNGELAASLKAETEFLQISNRVIFLPAQAGIEKFMNQARFFLMPSLWEGLGIVVMEAMAAGRVVIASNTGGIPEMIIDGKSGFLLPADDVLAWANGLRKIFTDNNLEAVVRAGQIYACANFSVIEMVKKYEQLYQSLLA